MDQISDLAVLSRPVTITGGRGTGKGLLAARLHFLSPRWEQSFLSFDCSAQYIESQIPRLFGNRQSDGIIRDADGGTLMIDHIDHLSFAAQKRLLSLIETGEVWPDDGEDPVPVNIRIIALTRNNLPALAARGLFDLDLLDRLAFAHIHVPRLKDRKQDILPLVQYFGRKMAQELGAESFPGFTPEAMLDMERQNWAGNIGALKTAVERSVAESFLADESLALPIPHVLYNPLDAADALGLDFEVPASLVGAQVVSMAASPTPHEGTAPHNNTASGADDDTPPTPQESPNGFHARIFAFERALIDEAMGAHKSHQGKAAQHLGMTYHAFRGLLRKHGLKK
jgi:psp operon transcriptional activator